MVLSIRSGLEPVLPPQQTGTASRSTIERATARRAAESFRQIAAQKPATTPAAGRGEAGLAGVEAGDRADISAEGRRLAEQATNRAETNRSDGGPQQQDLTQEQEQQVQELKARDREVRQHEQAHLAAAGDLARGGPTYTYQTGPDGRRYAVGGEVQIQLRESKDPEKTLQDARRAKRAALAPAEPSSQDRQVASQADALALQAQREISESRRRDSGESENASGAGPLGPTDNPSGGLLDVLA